MAGMDGAAATREAPATSADARMSSVAAPAFFRRRLRSTLDVGNMGIEMIRLAWIVVGRCEGAAVPPAGHGHRVSVENA